MRDEEFVSRKEFVKMSQRCDALEQQNRRLEELVARGFGQMVEAKEPCVQLAARQVTQTVKGWWQNRKKANENSR